MAKSKKSDAATPVQKAKRTYEEQYEAGRALRAKCPRNAHAAWKPPSNRPDPVELVLAAEKGRIPELLPLRHGRMVRSAFTFYRGSALAMASDLSSTPNTGVHVQCCGDAHLCNFGGYATAERRIVFSVNDLDETLPAPWEWDIKRLAASFVIACRDKGFSDANAKGIVMTCVRTYRESMEQYSHMKTLDLWYHALVPEELPGMNNPAIRKRVTKRIEQERAKSRGEELFPKLVEHKGGIPIIRDQLPTIFHDKGNSPGKISQALHDAFAGYRSTLPSSYQALFDRFKICDAAVKVVGIGSVGTACWVILLLAAEDDPLFLQVKEARPSVLEPFAGKSVFPNHGQRVVNGYRAMQPASDVLLGWARGPKRDFFVRQLRDVKISPRVDIFGRTELDLYARFCGKALALSHARAGSSAVLSGYMGKSDTFDRALAAFSVAYADQNEKDHAALERAVKNNKVEAVFEEDR